MPLNAILHYSAACFCAGVVVFAILRDRRNFVNWVFALGIGALALESFFTGLNTQAIFPEQAIRWQHWSLTATALVPGIWLLFGLSFAQEDFRSLHTGWRCEGLGQNAWGTEHRVRGLRKSFWNVYFVGILYNDFKSGKFVATLCFFKILSLSRNHYTPRRLDFLQF